jgi:hypothetical protein
MNFPLEGKRITSLAKMTEDGIRCSVLEEPLMSIADATSAEDEEDPSSQIGTPVDSPKNRRRKTTIALPLSKLCSKCQNILAHWNQIPYLERNADSNDNKMSSEYSTPRKHATFSHHNSLLELESSAKEGCTLCGQFVKDERILEACRKRIQELRKRFLNRTFVGHVEVGPEQDNCWWLLWDIVPSSADSDGPIFNPRGRNSRFSTSTESLEVYIIPTPEPGKLLRRKHASSSGDGLTKGLRNFS